MRWPDFCSVFTDIDLVRLFDYENVCLTVCGRSSYEDNAEDGIIILHVQSKVPALVLSIGQSDHTVHPVHTVRKKSRSVHSAPCGWPVIVLCPPGVRAVSGDGIGGVRRSAQGDP